MLTGVSFSAPTKTLAFSHFLPMSPFAVALRAVRFERGLNQQDVADLAGCDRSYLSALENDQRAPPTEAFLDGLISGLSLTEEEAEVLRRARLYSRRTYTLPEDAAKAVYVFAHELFSRLDRLTSRDFAALTAVLKLTDPHPTTRQGRDANPRGGHQIKKEAPM